MTAIGMGMSSHYSQWTTVLPCPPFLKLGESKISHISGTCSYLGVSSTYQRPSSAYLQESGTGGIQEGLVWLWAIMEMTVCYEALADHARSEHPPLHSLHYPTGDISAPSIAKMLLQHWRNKRRRTARLCSANQSAAANSTNAGALLSSFFFFFKRNCNVEQRENMWDAAVEQRGVHLLEEIGH